MPNRFQGLLVPDGFSSLGNGHGPGPEIRIWSRNASRANSVRLEKRLQALEARLSTEPVILFYADGSTRELRGSSGFLLDLFCACGRPDITPAQSAYLELIGQSVGSTEQGGSRLLEVIRVFLHGPAGPRDMALVSKRTSAILTGTLAQGSE